MELGFTKMSDFHNGMKIGDAVFNQKDLLEYPLSAINYRLEMADKNLYAECRESLLDISEKLCNKTLPLTMVHYDFCVHHLLKDKGGIRIIDWDTAVDNSFPIYDSYRFISSLIFSIARSCDTEINYKLMLEFYKRDNNFVKLLSKHVKTYSDLLQIEFDIILYSKMVMLNELISRCLNR